jgi:hypothetical protein
MVTDLQQLGAINRVGGVMIRVDTNNSAHMREYEACSAQTASIRSTGTALAPG